MGSGASKDNAGESTQSSPRRQHQRPAGTISKRGQFQEVEVRASTEETTTNNQSNGDVPTQDSKTQSSSKKSNAGRRYHRNRYARHAHTANDAQTSLTHGQTVAATSRGGQGQSQRRRNDQKDEDLIFETFMHMNGKEFVCVVHGGKRYYLDDWHSHEWQLFPERWYKEGQIVPIVDAKQSARSSSSNQESGQNSESRQPSQQEHRDDREGCLKHPKRGQVETFLMEERHYVHFFFDRESGKWLRLPIGWELHHNLVKQMVDQVEVGRLMIYRTVFEE